MKGPSSGVDAMNAYVARLGDQLRESYDVARGAALPNWSGLRGVVVFGMGGSAAAAEVVGATLAPGRFDLRIVRDYAPVVDAGPETLHVFSSYSGETEETRSCFERTQERTDEVPCVVVSSGGTLAATADAAGVPVLPLPGGMPPRASLGHGVGLLCGLVERVGLADGVASDVDAAIARLDTGLRRWGLDGTAPADEALATWTEALAGRLPVVYAGAPVTLAAMRRLRAQLNENAKMLVATAEVPELDHNEIVGWGHPTAARAQTVVVALRDPDEHPRVARRFEVTREILGDRVPVWLETRAESGPALARALELVQWGDALSVALAAAHGVDPLPVTAIDTLKQALRAH